MRPSKSTPNLFLEAPDDPARASYDVADVPALERQLEQASAGLRGGSFEALRRRRAGSATAVRPKLASAPGPPSSRGVPLCRRPPGLPPPR